MGSARLGITFGSLQESGKTDIQPQLQTAVDDFLMRLLVSGTRDHYKASDASVNDGSPSNSIAVISREKKSLNEVNPEPRQLLQSVPMNESDD